MLPFPDKFLDFHPPKFLMTFFSHKFRIPPYFPCFSTFPLYFPKIIISPTLKNCPPCFRNIHLLLHTFCAFRFSPYFDHDAFMHHPMHVLDAPVACHWSAIANVVSACFFPVVLVITLKPRSFPASESGIPHIKTANRSLFSLFTHRTNMLSQCIVQCSGIVETIHFITDM